MPYTFHNYKTEVLSFTVIIMTVIIMMILWRFFRYEIYCSFSPCKELGRLLLQTLKPLLRDRIVSENMVKEMPLSGHNASFSIRIYTKEESLMEYSLYWVILCSWKNQEWQNKYFFTCWLWKKDNSS
jgi:hypothetical protein